MSQSVRMGNRRDSSSSVSHFPELLSFTSFLPGAILKNYSPVRGRPPWPRGIPSYPSASYPRCSALFSSAPSFFHGVILFIWPLWSFSSAWLNPLEMWTEPWNRETRVFRMLFLAKVIHDHRVERLPSCIREWRWYISQSKYVYMDCC